MEEPLSGGLVTAKDPALLQPGELAAARNAIYLPFDDGLYSCPGLSNWDVVSTANAVSGLTSCRFDNGTHLLVAQNGTAYYTADAEADSSPFTSIGTVTTGSQLQSVQFNNRWFILNGANPNLVLASDSTTRAMGLQPVTNQFAATATAASNFSVQVSGYYEYWFTERAELSDGTILESAYNAAKPQTIFVSANTGTAPQLTLPATFINNSATKFRLYRSPMKTTYDEQVYPAGTSIADVGAGAVFLDGGTATTDTARLPASVDTNTLWANEANISADDAAVTTLAKSAAGANQEVMLLAYNFPFGTLSGNITGLTVTVDARGTSPTNLSLRCGIGKRTASHTVQCPSGGQIVPLATLSANSTTGVVSSTTGELAAYPLKRVPLAVGYTTMTLGGTADDWLAPGGDWSTVDFDGTFCVFFIGSFKNAAGSGETIDIDHIKLAVSYAGPTIADGDPYPAVTVEVGGVESSSPTNMPPPISSTGCVYNGSIVLNDITRPSTAVYSQPGSPESFPTLYFLDFETDDNDQLTYLGTVNGLLVAGMKGSLWRINYLPNEDDASFNRGRAVDLISDAHGILRPTCATLFSGSDGRQELAFCSPNGLFATDGYSVRDLMLDLQWIGPQGIFVGLSSSIYTQVIAVLNDPFTQTLRLVLQGSCYTASYATRHRKPGSGVKWTGPNSIKYSSGGVQRLVASSHIIRRAGGVYIIVHGRAGGASGGNVVREDAADNWYLLPNTLQDTNSNKLLFTTRDLFPAGRGAEFELNEIGLYGRNFGTGVPTITPPDGSLTVATHHINAADQAAGVKTLPTGTSSKLLVTSVVDCSADSMAITFTETATSPMVAYSLFLKVQPGGEVKRA